MIIRKKNSNSSDSNPQSNDTGAKPVKKSKVIKKEDLDLSGKKKNSSKEKKQPVDQKLTFEKIDVSSIEFKERVERRRGDRRRGYRRIDERSLVSRAQQEAHNIKELAAREGYQVGLKKAQDEVEYIKNSLLEFLNLRSEMYEEFYPHIMEIALAAAEKIIKQQVELSQDILKNIIITTMEEMSSNIQKVEIKVNPKDVEFARASLPEIIASRGDDIKITIGQDAEIEAGSCIVVANNGVIDANFKTQLAVLQNAFGIYKGGI